MKRFLFAALLLASLASFSPVLRAQDSAVAIAEREEAEIRYRRMTAEIEDLKTALQSTQQRVRTLSEELRSVRQELERANSSNRDAATKESIKQLEDALREVDRKRIADNEKVLAEFSKLARSLGEKVAAPLRSNPGPTPPSTGSESGYEYTIRSGDVLSKIVRALREQKGMKITEKQVEEANPGVNWLKLKIGQKIFIPAPSQP